jgi:hypothetical protein
LRGSEDVAETRCKIAAVLRIRLALITIVALLCATPTGALATQTQSKIFYAFTQSGKPTIPTNVVSGYCWTGSLAIPRSDAWRCFVGNYIYDPCFSSATASGEVVCPNANLSSGLLIRLTKPLPYRYADRRRPSLADPPWDLETVNGEHYVLLTGAGEIVDGKRGNYGCSCGGRTWLRGLPDRSSHPWWTIFSAPYTAKRLTAEVGIRYAWI